MPRFGDSTEEPSDSDYFSSDSDSYLTPPEDLEDLEPAHDSPVEETPSSRIISPHTGSTSRSSQGPRQDEDDVYPESTSMEFSAAFETPKKKRAVRSAPPSCQSPVRSRLARMSLGRPAIPTGITPTRLFQQETPSRNAQTISASCSDAEADDEGAEISEASGLLTDTNTKDNGPPKGKKEEFTIFTQGAESSFSSIDSASTALFSVTRESSLSSVGSSGSTMLQPNQAVGTAAPKNQSATQGSSIRSPRPTPERLLSLVTDALKTRAPTQGSPIRGPRPTKERLLSLITDVLKTTAPTPPPEIGSSAPESSTAMPMRMPPDKNKGKAPVRLGCAAPHSMAAASSSAITSQQAPESEPSPALRAFANSKIGSHLGTVVICHDAQAQQLLDNAQIAWGVQYELARGVTEEQWTWDDVIPKIDSLKGDNATIAARVSFIMESKDVSGPLNTTLWEELDREQAAILEHRQRGLGGMGEWMGVNPWWGGRIQQLAKLTGDKGSYKIILEPMEQRRCHRLARFLGSRRVFQLRISQDMIMKDNEGLFDFLSQKFVVCGRVFIPLSSKDNGVYLVEVDEDYQRLPKATMGDQHRLGLMKIIQWANSLERNFDQPISKWSARFALTLSNSVPALQFDEKEIYELDDLYAPSYNGQGKASAERILTDGCGFMNAAALKRIQAFIGLDFRPTAVQGRIKGAKGVWTLDPTDDHPEPRIWLRKSQIKVNVERKPEEPLHPSQRTFDFLAYSRPSSSVSLSAQTIMNLHFNGVPTETLVSLMERGLREEVEPLTKWEGPHALQILWDTVAKIGGVPKARAVRMAGALSRARGLEGRDWGNEDVDASAPNRQAFGPEDFQDAAEAASTGRRPATGAPLSLHEAAMDLLQAGFRPQEFPILRDKLKYILETHIKSIVEKFNIPLTLAVNNYVIPDPCGVLEADEVYYRSSSSFVDPATQNSFNVFTGPVLIGRYPVRLPSDIQKVTAVDHPELAQYPDVLIVSTKGEVSIASLLSGGDYDGDECFLIAEPAIVEPFQSKPLYEQPPEVTEDFEKHVTRVNPFVEELAGQPADKPFVKQLLLGLHDSKKGLYSKFHDIAVWRHGYDHPCAIKLAYMFNTLLDSGKTGLRLKEHVFERDRKAFNGGIPDLNQVEASGLEPSILHILTKAGIRNSQELDRTFKSLCSGSTYEEDPDLLQPFISSLHRLGDLKKDPIRDAVLADREAIRNHVQHAYHDWKSHPYRPKPDGSRAKKTPHGRQVQPDARFEIERKYAAGVGGVRLMDAISLNLMKASFAYYFSPRFALDIAFTDICTLKATSTLKGLAPVTRDFDEAKAVTNAYMRAVASLSSD